MALLGFDAHRLLDAKAAGVRFDRTLTVGRLDLYLHPGEVHDLDARLQAMGRHGVFEGYTFNTPADRFLTQGLGISQLTVLDNSDYEGATLVHDLNQPLPAAAHGAFDAVIEAGTLEHVFNFPVAIASLMQAVSVGGTVFLTTPANNLCGHGFYQFSPEVMFRIFAPENGFRVDHVRMMPCAFPAVELTPSHDGYDVTDPADVRRRVGLRSSRPAMMAVQATRVDARPPFATPPLQSDYVAKWEAGAVAPPPSRLKQLASRLPQAVRGRLIGYFHLWEYSFWNRRAYRRRR